MRQAAHKRNTESNINFYYVFHYVFTFYICFFSFHDSKVGGGAVVMVGVSPFVDARLIFLRYKTS